MLPFMKQKEGAIAMDVDVKDMGEDESYGIIDAIADDLMQAITKRDKELLRETIEALCDYIRAEDEEQDANL